MIWPKVHLKMTWIQTFQKISTPNDSIKLQHVFLEMPRKYRFTLLFISTLIKFIWITLIFYGKSFISRNVRSRLSCYSESTHVHINLAQRLALESVLIPKRLLTTHIYFRLDQPIPNCPYVFTIKCIDNRSSVHIFYNFIQMIAET